MVVATNRGDKPKIVCAEASCIGNHRTREARTIIQWTPRLMMKWNKWNTGVSKGVYQLGYTISYIFSLLSEKPSCGRERCFCVPY